MDRRQAFARALFARHFTGAAFSDELFNTDNNDREKACAFRIQSSMPRYSPLTNGSWAWRAVGIPLTLVDRSIDGDIDLMFAVSTPPTARGHLPRHIYRCFELKTSKVTRSGDVRSLKEHKFRKTVKQLEKLLDFGAPQVFLLEAFIVEAGFSLASGARMPTAVRNSIANKLAQIKGLECGFAALPLEQIPGYAEVPVAMLWPTETIKRAAVRPMRPPFSRLVERFEAYAKSAHAHAFRSVISYCHPCRNLTLVASRGPYTCGTCKAPLI
jgi:hypothetical protein